MRASQRDVNLSHAGCHQSALREKPHRTQGSMYGLYRTRISVGDCGKRHSVDAGIFTTCWSRPQLKLNSSFNKSSLAFLAVPNHTAPFFFFLSRMGLQVGMYGLFHLGVMMDEAQPSLAHADESPRDRVLSPCAAHRKQRDCCLSWKAEPERFLVKKNKTKISWLRK